jgi:hypothetical protein
MRMNSASNWVVLQTRNGGTRVCIDPTTEALPGRGRLSVRIDVVDRVLVPWQLVRVSGPSMVPTLRHGDLLLVRLRDDARTGDIVLARFRSMPERFVVKRVGRRTDAGVELLSDNTFAGGDSAVHGLADVLGRVLLRRPAGSWRVRRV